jgi:hypothetical protein
MRRRQFLGLIGGAAAWPLAARAQQGQPLIGVLNPLSRAAVPRHIEALRSGLRAAGYVEGQNIRLEWRFAEGSLIRMRPLADELVALNPNVIIVGSAAAILTATCRTSIGKPQRLRTKSLRVPTRLNSDRAADQVRASGKSQDRQGGRLQNFGIVLDPRRRGDRVTCVRARSNPKP